MELDSVEAAYQLYNLYGFKIGFSTRKAQQYHSAIGEKKLISQRFVCSNEGYCCCEFKSDFKKTLCNKQTI